MAKENFRELGVPGDELDAFMEAAKKVGLGGGGYLAHPCAAEGAG